MTLNKKAIHLFTILKKLHLHVKVLENSSFPILKLVWKMEDSQYFLCCSRLLYGKIIQKQYHKHKIILLLLT